MDDKSSNSMNMIRATVQLCDNNTAATATITMFPAILTTVKNKVTLIDQLEQTVLTNTTGVTLDIYTLRRAMSTVAIICSDAVTAYANSVNNNTLKTQVSYTYYQLTRLKKEEVVDVCQIIHDAANANIGNAQNFGIIPTDVNDLQSAIDLYRVRLQNPRQAVVNKNVANRQIKALIFEIKNQYFKLLLDKMVDTLQNTNPTFVQQYKSIREIIDLGSNSPNPTPTPSEFINLPVDQTTPSTVSVKTKGKATATGTKQFKLDWGDGNSTIGTAVAGVLADYPHTYTTPGQYNIKITAITASALEEFDVLQIDNCKLFGTITIPASVQLSGIQVPNNLVTRVLMQPACYAFLVSFILYNNNMDASSVNENLIGLDNSGQLNGIANFGGGTNDAPTGLGIAAKNSLIAKGWTVITN